MIIKRWNTSLPGDNKWEEQYPKTTANQIFDNAGTTAVFDSYNKIKPAYLPDSVFDSLMFDGTASGSDGNARDRAASMLPSAFFANRSLMGYYKVVSSPFTLEAASSTVLVTLSNNTNWSGSSGQPVITTAVTGLSRNYRPGLVVEGSGIPLGATILSINYDTDAITLSNNLNGNVVVATVISFKTYMKADISFGEEDAATSDPGSVDLETGDWFVVTKFTGTGTIGDPYYATFGIVNNTYELMKGASSLAGGAPGLVPAPSTGEQGLYLRGDGDWATPLNTTYDIATEETAGLVEIAHTKLTGAITIQPAGTTTDRYYGVTLNNLDQMVVNVPWVDTDTTYLKATDSALGLVETAFADLTSNPSLTETNDGARYYGVQLNQAQQMVVNVPWENTTYTTASNTVLGLVKLGYGQANTQGLVTLPAENSKVTSRQYGVQVDSTGNASVYVPWENSTYTAGVGLGLSSGAFSMTQPHVVSAAEPATTFRKENTLWFDI